MPFRDFLISEQKILVRTFYVPLFGKPRSDGSMINQTAKNKKKTLIMIPCDDVVSKFLNCIFMLRDRRGFGDLLSWRISFFRVVPFSCHCLTLHSSSYTQTQIVCRSFNFSLDSSYQLQDSGGRTVGSKPSTEHNAVRHTQALSHHTRARRLRGHQDRWSIE